MTVTECLNKILELTNQNLEILKTLNDSFYTKRTSLIASVGENRYTIPSFISLENKYNHLQDAFNNLVRVPQTGEAWYNFDGNSREIVCRGYQAAPNPIELEKTKTFGHETVYHFKDLLTPQPYINIDLNSIPDDITQVRVKKIVPYNSTLQSNLTSYMDSTDENPASALIEWSDMKAELLSGDPAYVSGTDYLEYDKTYTLPVRKMTCSGEYIITELVDDTISDDGDEIVTVIISEDTPLSYTLFDGTTSKSLSAGDYLTTYDGGCRLQVEEIYSNSNKLVLRVVHSEYVNLHAYSGDDISNADDYSRLRFYRPSDFDKDKYIHIPLEEDEYVYIAIAPLNSRMNTQSAWGTGIFLDVDKLTDEDGVSFRTYYNQNVTNLGDMIVELSNIMSPSITKYSEDEYKLFTESIPLLSEDTFDVVQINKHLNDSETVQNIRSLYSQKQQYNIDLSEVQSRITSLTSELAEVSFDDTSGTRSMYEAQIAELKTQQNELTTSITKVIDDIALAANNAEIPIENAKFRIRGYVDVEGTLQNIFGDDWLDYLDLVQGVQVQYRYKNSSNPQANVDVINDFLFTEWCEYDSPSRSKSMSYSDGSYSTSYSDADSSGLLETENVPKFNQVDIPITQGESVDIRTRIIWAFGYPFATVSTDWSETLNIEFPSELVQDVQVTTIIEENNSDIETNRFETILDNKGIIDHVDDSLVDQDITYYHKPESIASGFYTDERRVIPLKDKLSEIDSAITEIQDTIEGTTSESLSVTLTVESTVNTLDPDVDNSIQLPAYSSVTSEDVYTGTAILNGDVVEIMGVLGIGNKSEHTVNIFSMFPASRDMYIGELDESHVKYDQTDFVPNYSSGIIGQAIAIQTTGVDTNEVSYSTGNQRGNQYIVFRYTNPYDGSPIIESSTICKSNTSYLSYSRGYMTLSKQEDVLVSTSGSDIGTSWVYAAPYEQPTYSMCLNSDTVSSKLVIPSGESITIPIIIRYMINSSSSAEASYTIGFNLRNSLYSDPLYYQFTLNAKYTQSIQDSLVSKKASVQNQTKYNVTVR